MAWLCMSEFSQSLLTSKLKWQIFWLADPNKKKMRLSRQHACISEFACRVEDRMPHGAKTKLFCVLQQNEVRKEVNTSAVVLWQSSTAENPANLRDDQTNWFRPGRRWLWKDVHSSLDLDLGDDLWSAALKSKRAFMPKDLSEKQSHTSQCWGRTTLEQNLQLHAENITEITWVKPSPSFSGKNILSRPCVSENTTLSHFIELLEIPHQPNL